MALVGLARRLLLAGCTSNLTVCFRCSRRCNCCLLARCMYAGVPVCVRVYAGKVCLQVLLKSSCTAHCCAHVDSWLVCLNEYKCNYLCGCVCTSMCVKRISGKLATVSVSSHLNWKCAVCLIFNLQSFGAAANQCVSRSRSVR